MASNLDDVSKAIIEQLQQDGRRSYASIGKVVGLSEAEPDADRIAQLVDQVEAYGVTTVFYEELVSPRVAATVAREAGVETAVLSPVEGLTEEQLEAGKDYAAVMRDNLGALRRALGCR